VTVHEGVERCARARNVERAEAEEARELQDIGKERALKRLVDRRDEPDIRAEQPCAWIGGPVELEERPLKVRPCDVVNHEARTPEHSLIRRRPPNPELLRRPLRPAPTPQAR